MEKVEEILPRITEFIKIDLARESLSPLAERTRLYYVERIAAVFEESQANNNCKNGTVTPPMLMMETQQEITSSSDSLSLSAAHAASALLSQRRSSVLHGNIVTKPFRRTSIDVNGRGQNIDSPDGRPYTGDGAYEMLPWDQSEDFHAFDTRDQNNISSTDVPTIEEDNSDFNDTDYENNSNEEEEVGSRKKILTPTSNNYFMSQLSLAFSNSSKPTKYADLTNKTYGSDLYQKGMLNQYTKRYCAVCDNEFFCCKSEKDLKIVLSFHLSEYDVTHQEKDGKFSQELRFSNQNRQNYVFFTDDKEAALQWIQEIGHVVKEVTSADTDDNKYRMATEEQADQITDDGDQQSISTLSSENISGGSVDKNLPQKQTSDALTENKKKSKIQTLFGTFGKKKGSKLKLAAYDVVNCNSQDALVGGYIRVCCEATTGKKWVKRFCMVHSGNLYCKKDMLEERPELIIPLPGGQIYTAGRETKKEATVKLITMDGNEFFLEILDPMEHGRWMQVLIAETGFASQMNKHYKLRNATSLDQLADGEKNLTNSVLNLYHPRLPSSSPPVTPPVELNPSAKPIDPIYIEPVELPAELLLDMNENPNITATEDNSVYMNLSEVLPNSFNIASVQNDKKTVKTLTSNYEIIVKNSQAVPDKKEEENVSKVTKITIANQLPVIVSTSRKVDFLDRLPTAKVPIKRPESINIFQPIKSSENIGDREIEDKLLIVTNGSHVNVSNIYSSKPELDKIGVTTTPARVVTLNSSNRRNLVLERVKLFETNQFSTA